MTSAANARPACERSEDSSDEGSLFDAEFVRDATLLVVDDEPLITTSLRRFLQLEMGIENVVAFNVSADAAHWSEQNQVDLVVTDFLMPGMDGLALLLHVKRVHPEATRVLLTGYADKANAIRAINEVGLFQYIEKPWDTDRLTNVIRTGLEYMALQRTLRRMIDKLTVEQGAREHMRRAFLRALA